MAYIYALIDPRDGRVRYIGQTIQPLEQRLTQHVRSADRDESRRANWIRSISALGLQPAIELVATVPDDTADRYEIWFIARYREAGFDLVNQTDGGNGGPKTEEHRRKIGESKRGKPRPDLAERNRKGLSVETRAKIAEAHRGTKQSAELIEKRISKIRGGKHSETVKANMRSAAKKRRRDPATGLWVDKSGLHQARKYECRICGETFDQSHFYAGHMAGHGDWSHLSKERSDRMSQRWMDNRDDIVQSIKLGSQRKLRQKRQLTRP